MLCGQAGASVIQSLMEQADADGDGELSKTEFRDFYRRSGYGLTASRIDLAAVTRKVRLC